ncbi:hypothetical protein JCM11251_006294 [Rhodosporidiobolus azoricus]
MLRTTATHIIKRAKTTSAKEGKKAAATATSSSREGEKPDPTIHAHQPSKVHKVTPANASADYQRKLEERFGGGESAALGTLVNGQPQGMQRGVQKNLFRLI